VDNHCVEHIAHFSLTVSLAIATLLGIAQFAHAQQTITLQFDSLPSAQGWTYFQGGSIPETSVFSVTGTSLIQNTIGTGFAIGISPNYAMFNVVEGAQPFVLKVRARVIATEGTDTGGFFFDVRTATPNQEYAMLFTTSSVSDPLGNSVAIDTTVFHDYVLMATPGSNYNLYIDGTLSLSGPFSATGGALNAIQLGDGNSLYANAQAEVTQFVFTTGVLQLTCDPTTGPAQVGTPYTADCTASGGTPPYSWSISSGTLPPGINPPTGSANTATITGTPTQPGSYSYTVQVTDSSAPTPQTAQQVYTGNCTRSLYVSQMAIFLNHGLYVLFVRLKNNGTEEATNVTVTVAQINTTLPLAPLPHPISNIPAGSETYYLLAFPSSAGISGQAAKIVTGGSYNIIGINPLQRFGHLKTLTLP